MEQTFTVVKKYKKIFSIIMPILVTQIAMYFISFFDTLMSSKYGTNDLAAVSIGSSIWLPVYTGLVGILFSITPIVAQLVGAEKRLAVKKIVQQGIYIAILLGIITFVGLRLSIQPLLAIMELEKEVARIAKGYILSISFGIFPLFLYTVIRCYIDALGKTRVTMLITLLTVPMNIFMNYLFIFGHFGMPELGGVGAGIGSAITYWIVFIVAAIIASKQRPFRDDTLHKGWGKIDILQWKEILQIGFLIGFTILAESSIFSVVTLLMSNYSTAIIGAHQIALNFATLLYMIPLSISMGATILVGYEVGAKRFADAKIYSFLCIGTSIGFSILSMSILFVFSEQIASIYTADTHVVEYAVRFLMYAMIFQFSDAIQVPIQGVLRGYKDVQITFMIAFISYWIIGLPVGYSLATYTDFGPFGYWIGLVTGLTAGAIILSLRLKYVQHQLKSV